MIDRNDPVYQIIVGAKIQLLLSFPFFGQMAMRLDVVDATTWCKSMATDGKRLYYNREFIKKSKPSEIEFYVCHEILHAVFMHMTRRGNRDKGLYDMACDYLVNFMIKQAGVGKMPEGALYKDEYNDDLSVEELYEILKKNCVSISDIMDDHLDFSGDGDGDEESQGGGSGGGKGMVYGEDGPPRLSKEEIDAIKDSLTQALQDTAQSCSAGDIPNGVMRLINELTDPQMDWRELLFAQLKSLERDDFSYACPNRRNYSDDYDGIIFAGQDYLPTIKVGCAIDTSGSVSDEMVKDFMSEVKGIMEQFRSFELWLWTFDTQVYGLKKFVSTNLADVYEYKINGRGGTLFEPNWTEMILNPPENDVDGNPTPAQLEIDQFLLFTDGYPCNTWGEEFVNVVDTLFVVHSDKKVEAPFGTTIHYTKDAA